MVRLLFTLLISVALASLTLALAGCAQFGDVVDAWKQAHPTTQLTDHAVALGGAAVESVVTGSYMPVIKQGLEVAGWLLGLGATAVAARKSSQVRALTAPWDASKPDRRRRRSRSRATDVLADAGGAFVAPAPDPQAVAVISAPRPLRFLPDQREDGTTDPDADRRSQR